MVDTPDERGDVGWFVRKLDPGSVAGSTVDEPRGTRLRTPPGAPRRRLRGYPSVFTSSERGLSLVRQVPREGTPGNSKGLVGRGSRVRSGKGSLGIVYDKGVEPSKTEQE